MELEEQRDDNEAIEIDDEAIEDDLDEDEMYEDTRDSVSSLLDYLTYMQRMFKIVRVSEIPPAILQYLLPKGVTAVLHYLKEIELTQYDVLDLNEVLAELEHIYQN